MGIRLLHAKLQKMWNMQLRSVAVVPFIVTTMLAGSYTDGYALDRTHIMQTEVYQRHNMGYPSLYTTFNIYSPNAMVGYSRQIQPRVSSNDDHGYSEPAMNYNKPRVVTNRASIGYDDRGMEMTQQSYGGFWGLAPEFHTGNLGNFGQHHWIHKNHYYYAHRNGHLNVNIWGSDFHQHVGSEVDQKVRLYVKLTVNLRAGIELYTGTVVAQQRVAWNEGFKIAIRGTQDPVGNTRTGIDVTLDNATVFGAIQGTPQEDKIDIWGGTIQASKYFSGYDYISLGAGDDTLDMSGRNGGIYIGGHIFMGSGNDSINLMPVRDYELTSLNAGPGNDFCDLGGVTRGTIRHGIYMGEGNDTLRYYVPGELNIGGTIYMGSGNDSVEIRATPHRKVFDLGSGDNTLRVIGNIQNLTQTTLVTGTGNNLIDFGSSSYDEVVMFGRGHNTIRVSTGSYSSSRHIYIPSDSALYLEANTSGGRISVNSIGNDGLFGLRIGNGASYNGPTAAGNGRVDIYFYNGSHLRSNFTSGRGDDRFTLENIQTNFGIDAGTGHNTINTNGITINSIASGGHDSITLRNSTITGNVILDNLSSQMQLENLNFTGAGLSGATRQSTNLTMSGSIGFSNNAQFVITKGMHNIEIHSLDTTRNGNKGVLDFRPTYESNILLTGTLRMGDIRMTTAKANVIFNGATADTFGNLVVSSNNDNIVFTNRSRFSGALNLGNSSHEGDTISLQDSTITAQGKIEYGSKLNLYGRGNSQIDGTVKASSSIHIGLSGTSYISGDIVHATDNLIDVLLENSSAVQGRMQLNTSIPLNFQLVGRNDARFITDIVSGEANDTILISLYDNMTYTGAINTNGGNNLLELTSNSRNGNIVSIRAGNGNDTARLRSGVFPGGTNFWLGQGNNSVELSGSVRMPGDLIVYETSNTTTEINMLQDSELYANINTGSVEGNVIIGNNSTVHGSVQGLGAFSVSLGASSLVKGDITAGNGDAYIALDTSIVEGNVQSNRGRHTRGIIRNSTIHGGISAVTNGADVSLDINQSNVAKDVLLNNAVLLGGDNTFNGNVIVQGNSDIRINNSNISRDLTMGLGTSFVSLNANTLGGGFTLVDGDYNLVVDDSHIVGSLDMRQARVTMRSRGSTIDGDIIMSPTRESDVENTLDFQRATIGGDVSLTRNMSFTHLRLRESSLKKTLALGIGKNDVEIVNSTIEGTLFFNGESTVVLNHTSVHGKLDFTNPALRDQHLTIIGNTWNAITFGRVNNTISIQDARLKSDSGYALRGGTLLDDVTLTNTFLEGSIALGAGNDILRIISSTIHGSIDMEGGINTLVLNKANVQGDIIADFIEVDGDSQMIAPQPNTDSSFNFGKPTHTSIARVNNGAVLFVTPGSIQDTLNIYGKVHVDEGSMGIDVDFINGHHDTIVVKSGALIYGGSQFLCVRPTNVFTGAEQLLEVIPEVLIAESMQSFQFMPRLRGMYLQAGGYLYELRPDDVDSNKFNLVQAGEDPLNYGYGTMALSSRNYSRSLLDSLQEHNIVTMLSSSDERKSYGKKNNQDIFTAWGYGGVASNAVSAPFIPKVKSTLAIALFGVDVKEIDIAKKNRFLLRFFGGYGQSASKYMYETWEVKGEMTAYSAGAQFIWENLRNSRYRLYVRATTWGDMFQNKLQNIISFQPEEWDSLTVSSALAMGLKMKFNRFIVIPEVEMVYSYHSASEFISMTKNLVEIKEAHQLTTKIQGTAGYNTTFGLTPYVRIALEIPMATMPKNADGVYIAGQYYKYGINDILTRIGVGLNYAISTGGVDITAYLDAAAHFGRENGARLGFGFALGF